MDGLPVRHAGHHDPRRRTDLLGGHPSHPLWFENLVVEPIVDVQVGSDVFSARASVVVDESRYQRLWAHMVSIWPGFDEYKEKTARVIPLVALTPQ